MLWPEIAFCHLKADHSARRFVGLFGDRRTKRILRSALKWEVLPYPKREQVGDTISPEFDYALGELSNSVPDVIHVV